MRLRKRWKVVFGILGALVVALVVPALIPPGRRYDPAPYLLAVKRSAALPATRGDTPQAGDLIIRRVRIVDVNGVRGPTSIRIQAGRITAIGDDVGGGPTELDVGGATVMPGLIDSH